MMNNAWKINDGDKTYGKAWAGEDNSKASFGNRPNTS
jgi:hypothetical protein